MAILRHNISAAVRVMQALGELEPVVEQAAAMIGDCLTGGHKLLICGNGGSAADASHMATEFVCRYQGERPPYPAIALTDAGSTLAAIGNDYDFPETFARQVRAFARPGDLLIVLSTSGKSPNVHKALEAAKACGIESIALLGRDGGICADLATVEMVVRDEVTARIQEAHKLLIHTLCEMVEPRLT